MIAVFQIPNKFYEKDGSIVDQLGQDWGAELVGGAGPPQGTRLRVQPPIRRRVGSARVANTLSIRRPSRSTTSKRQPDTTTASPVLGRRCRVCASTKPATV